MSEYNHTKIEKKWQKQWEENNLYKTTQDAGKEKFYILDMFPYPSGAGLHVGHPKGYIATDIISRFKKMNGYNVLHPMGWDAFGLPAEQYALKNKVHPREATEKNIATFKEQLNKISLNYDWEREISTTDPDFYKWTQWAFIQMFKKGLVYRSNEPINWCPSCKTGLANEDLENGNCERCDTPIEKKRIPQWVIKITKYADRLLEDLDELEWQEHIKELQRNWIGKSEGAEIEFTVKDSDEKIKVFTTRPDTLFGATYMVLAPEHALLETLNYTNTDEVEKYKEEAQRKSEIDRLDATKEKTGVKLEGVFAINPANNEEIPIYIADYVLAHYGTGAIMAVPAHDERDYEFAKKFGISIVDVVIPERIDKRNPPVEGKESIERRNVHAYIKDPKTGKVLCLKWKKFDWLTLPMGGIEEGETEIEAAKREVAEETGYTNLSEGKIMGGKVRAEYFAAHKDVNRVSITKLVYFELTGDDTVEIDKEESDAHDVVWLDPSEITLESMTHAEMDVWLTRVAQLDADHHIYTGNGVLTNSGEFDGMNSEEAKTKITEKVGGTLTNTYRLNDWVFSRQRYWGEPIPLVHCEGECSKETDGWMPIPESELPLTLPEVESYEPTGTGESPLANITEWVETKCPQCGGPAKRETNTMPQWAGSSWYYLRYIDPQNDTALVDTEKEKYWSPVDFYVGGAEHATRHLIYARFWHKFLYDIKAVNYTEPFKKLQTVGLIMAEDGRKMSKRWGNVINPDEIIDKFGADTLRVYEMFMGPFDQKVKWSTDGLIGARKWLERVWRLQEKIADTKDEEIEKELHKTIKKVSDDIPEMKFNTAIAQMMIFTNKAQQHSLTGKQYKTFLQLLAAFAPHMTEELWHEVFAEKESIHTSEWPTYDEALLVDDTAVIAIQVNGKLRGEITAPIDSDENEVVELLRKEEKYKKYFAEEPKKVILVKNKLINIVLP